MTFTDIQTDILDRLNLTSAEAIARVQRAINRKYREVTTAIGLVVTRRTELQQNATISSNLMTFLNCEKVLTVIDKSEGFNRILKEITYAEMEEQPISVDPPTMYTIERMNADNVTIRLNCVAQTAYTLYADVMGVAASLSGTDEPLFPESYHDILIEGVLVSEYMKLEKPQLAAASKKFYEDRLSDLRMWIAKSSWLDIAQGLRKDRLIGTGGVNGGGGGGGTNGAASYTQTGLITFDRTGAVPPVPFAVAPGSDPVANLIAEFASDAALLNGQPGTFYRNASNLNAGTLPDARFPATLPAISGVNLTNLNASALASGTVPDARFPAILPAASGVNLTALNASALASGTVAIARLAAGTFTTVTSTVATSQDNWAPGLVGNTLILWSGAANINFTGFAGGVIGQIIVFRNTGTNIATFPHNSGSSSAGNKLFNIATSAGTPVAANGHATYMYDGTQWQLIDHEQGAWITPTFSAAWFVGSGSLTWTVAVGDRNTHKYRLSGKSLSVVIDYSTTTTGGTAANLLTVSNAGWGGFTATSQMISSSLLTDAGGSPSIGIFFPTAGGTALNFRKADASNFSNAAADSTNTSGSVTFEVT